MDFSALTLFSFGARALALQLGVAAAVRLLLDDGSVDSEAGVVDMFRVLGNCLIDNF